MCRYAEYGPYKPHFACFNCRKAFRIPKKREDQAKAAADTRGGEVLCPQCRAPMVGMGLDFKAPKQTEVKQWQKVRILCDHGFKFGSCGCTGPGPRPGKLKEVSEFLEANLPKTDGQKLLEKYERRKGRRAKR